MPKKLNIRVECLSYILLKMSFNSGRYLGLMYLKTHFRRKKPKNSETNYQWQFEWYWERYGNHSDNGNGNNDILVNITVTLTFVVHLGTFCRAVICKTQCETAKFILENVNIFQVSIFNGTINVIFSLKISHDIGSLH